MTINTERLTKIAEWLENGAAHTRMVFDMRKGLLVEARFMPESLEEYNACRTTCCIAGAAVQFFNEPFEKLKNDKFAEVMLRDEGRNEISWWDIRREAQTLLGLTIEQARALFEPGVRDDFSDAPKELDKYNDAAWAARTIRHLIATGEVDWEITKA